eukprot:TRINITY_DN23012_c0_g1_i1.p1 TRINITY_DN23012_c0_g1~~TRINITY_DN23012_c0_g1_i1.p1  ORF type:complete len:167 (+),score=30.25 TRINITY_DN23012_c0_g1_i1:30-503(+)
MSSVTSVSPASGYITETQQAFCKHCDEVTVVTVVVGGEEVQVEIDPETGPVLLGRRGEFQHRPDHLPHRQLDRPRVDGSNKKPWKEYTATEREVAIHIAAKKNKARMAVGNSGAPQIPSIVENVRRLDDMAARYRAMGFGRTNADSKGSPFAVTDAS